MPIVRKRRVSLSRTALFLVLAAIVPLTSRPARGENPSWPPPEDATSEDLSDSMYWPDDPDYAWNTDGNNGQWNYYSFMVDNETVRPEETATGMSIDLAWRYTQGDQRVIIAITDSGIKWDEDDLIEAAFLNHAELVNHKPVDMNGNACTGDIDVPAGTVAGFDCNGDRTLTVADYAFMPTLLPEASDGHPKGDKNNNGRLDAGDLILNFSDGVDDDNNGYIDDISGWDFMKDDNDPYDDTRYGHGTGEARDSVSRANNGIGSAGGCNGCRFIPMRVGDSFITDVNDFAQATYYATDLGASLIQSALGTINNNRFAQSAIDYAYEHNVLTVASMADENSRHHNMPTVSNHTLPVHAIQFAGERITEARTFLQYHPCSNYGGQNFLSGAGTSCSSEAVGQTSGVVGLVYSAGLKYNRNLTAGEVFQLMIMGADDIDVPESREVDARDRWSQPGFDQRFGYGRVNANNAVTAVKDGRIPPEVDIVSPTWFSVLYKDQVTSPIEIRGTVQAKRATSFDYVVEWGPGVQPLDGEFTTIDEGSGGPTDVIGGESPIATFDIRNLDGFPIDPEKWDVDSTLGENQHTITVRVRAVAHYDGEIGDVPGEIRRTYYVHSDPDLVKGFPIYLGDGGEGSPKMADIDGDGVRELLYGTAGGELHVIKLTGSEPEELWGGPFLVDHVDGLKETPSDPSEPSYLGAKAYSENPGAVDLARESLTTNAPAIADLDGDGRPEIVAVTYAGTIYVIENDGTVRTGWPKRLPRVPSCSLDPATPSTGPCMSTESRIARGSFAAPVVEDMDQDGRLDVIVSAFDGRIYVFDADGSDVSGFPVEVRYDGTFGGGPPAPNRVFTTAAVADFNKDGVPDILVGSNQLIGEGGNSGAVYLVDGRGNDAPSLYLPNWPVTMTSLNLFPLVAEGITNSPVIGTFDGTQAAVAHGNASSPLIIPGDPGEQTKLNAYPPNILPQRTDYPNDGLDPSSAFGPLSKATQPNTMLPLFSQPALGDMDQDGQPDIVASGGSLNLAINLQSPSDNLKGDNLLSMWSVKTGKMLPASPMVLEDFTFFNSSAIADLTGDGYPEAIIGSGGYYVHAIDGCGREPEGWPKFTGQWIIPTPAVGDVDGDGKLEVAIGTRNGWLYLWHTSAPTTNVIEWESYHHDNRNTGNYDVALDQGDKESGAATPLTEAMCAPPGDDDGGDDDRVLTPSGGCACETAKRSHDVPAGALAAMAAMAAMAVARRRRLARA
ncbi:MAG: alkaline serine protease [Polyangiaceae bacterium]|nr:alkaline serine protease [Polyangiaceae bacterium]